MCQPNSTRSCYTGPAGTQGVGACRAGTQACAADGSGFGPCVGEVTPSPEVCNGIDDNCNGQTDDGAACPAAANATSTCSNGGCAVSCNPGFVDCNANPADGCECAGTGCCGGGCQTAHGNGLGQTFYDCTAPGTYNSTTASEACGAYTAVNSGSCAGGYTCGTTQPSASVCATNSVGCACWAYSGPAAGHVSQSSTGCFCPTLADPAWV